MIGRQVIKTNRAFTLEELEQFMREHWDTEKYNDFFIGRPTPGSIERYILLPATRHFMVIAYSRKAGGLFNKQDKVILTVCNTPEGVLLEIGKTLRTRSILYASWQISSSMSTEKERKGPAEDVLLAYTAHMNELLTAAGYVL